MLLLGALSTRQPSSTSGDTSHVFAIISGTLVDSDSIAVLAALESGRKLKFVYQWKTFFLPVADQLIK